MDQCLIWMLFVVSDACDDYCRQLPVDSEAVAGVSWHCKWDSERLFYFSTFSFRKKKSCIERFQLFVMVARATCIDSTCSASLKWVTYSFSLWCVWCAHHCFAPVRLWYKPKRWLSWITRQIDQSQTNSRCGYVTQNENQLKFKVWLIRRRVEPSTYPFGETHECQQKNINIDAVQNLSFVWIR